jgi:hypothetical protein
MTNINHINYIGIKNVRIQIYGLYLNKVLRASCPPPFGPAELFKFVPDELVRENMAAPGKLLLRCSTIGTPHRYLPVGDLVRSPLIHS